MIFEIDDVATIGGVADIPGYQLPPEAWTLTLNMRYAEDGIQSLDGWEQVFNSPPPIIPPHFSMPVVTSSQVFWPYVSLSQAAVWDGTTHTNITRTTNDAGVVATPDYTTSDTYQWNGTMLGEVAIFNNSINVPQQWAPAAVTTKFANLSNWPPTLRARVIRAFGSFLIAANLTDTADTPSEHPHRIRWSHPADPGLVPPSWDVADPTRDAGQIDLPDVSAGVLMELLPLGSTMYVYKESSIWRMRYVGGQSIFDFGQSSWITTAGLLGQRCVCVTGDGTKHVLATQDDIIWHNGNTVQSILNRRQRRRLQNEIDTGNFFQSFMFANPFNNEVWFCYPSQGQLYPNRALIMNYKEAGGNDFVVTEADGITFRNAAVGTIEAFTPEIWDQGTDKWDQFTGPWGQLERRRVVFQNPSESKFMKMGGVQQRDGVVFDTILQREGLGLIGKKRSGGPIVDHQKMKMLKRLWPKIVGGQVGIRFGAQQVVDGPIAWGVQATYNPSVDTYIDPGPVTGRAVGIEIASRDVLWRLDGYKVDVEPLGEY